MIDQKVIVALDYDNVESALSFVDKVDPNSCRLKVGKENVYAIWSRFRP